MHFSTRRNFLSAVAGTGLSSMVPSLRLSPPTSHPRDKTFLEIIRQPDSATVFQDLDTPQSASRAAALWRSGEVLLRIEPERNGLPIYISAPRTRLTHVHLRWETDVPSSILVMGDAWERSYGDLRWSYVIPERVMPWYFLTYGQEMLHGYGVRTGAGSFCFWQLDPDGVSLWLDISNGGSGVELGERELHAATVVSLRGEPGVDPLVTAKEFCREMCDAPRSVAPVIYGSNDWYYAYGRNSAEQIVRDAELMSTLAPSGGTRPFTVIDDGWQDREKYPDMTELAQAIRVRDVRPGLWIRPLEAPDNAHPQLLMPQQRLGNLTRHLPAYDPTIPEGLEAILDKVKQAVGWGYQLVKHDYTTFELLGRWGFQMDARPTLPNWNFHNRSKTTAEIVKELYTSIRGAAGDHTVLIGCNTIGHLAAGIFDVQRTGDDTSGQNWERTRRMGVNTLAYRLPQHRAFFLIDADCAPITKQTPWICTMQWLDLVARSGTALFVSPEPAAIGAEQQCAIREAFQVLQSAGTDVRPLDWQTSTAPRKWEFGPRKSKSYLQKTYDWYQQSGAWPYDI